MDFNVKTIVSTATIIASVITAVWAIDDRFALKGELEDVKKVLQAERMAGYDQLKDLILIQYEDQIQELIFKQNSSKLTPYEATRLNYLNKKLMELSK